MTLRALPGVDRRIRVLLVGDHDVMRLGLRSLLEASRWLEVVADVPTVAEAVVAAMTHHPALVLIVGPLGDGTGIDGCREVLARVHDARIVILSEHDDEASMLAATRMGAVACLSRRVGAQNLCRTLRDVATGGPAPPALAPVMLRAPGTSVARDLLALTAQERRVLELVAHGKTNKEIGSALGLSAKTVKNYLSHAFEKLNVSRRAQAAVLFIKDYGAGLVTRRSV
jgi:two-component system, NarL family, response regulator DevR